MAFTRKKEEDEFEEEQEEKFEKKTVSPKKFKDLKPENKKRRKEPPKPWGKKERLIVFSVLFVTVVASGVLSASARSWKLPGLPRIKLPSLSEMFEGETIIIEGNKHKDSLMQEKEDRIVLSFKQNTKNLSGIYSFYLVDLESGLSFGYLEDEKLQAASLIKLPVMAALYMEAEKGSLDLDTEYSLRNSDKVGGAGSIRNQPEGAVFTYRKLAEYMGKESDNTAFNIIVNRVLGEEKVKIYLSDLGMPNTSLSENITTPEEVGNLYQKLWEGKIISPHDRDEILTFLTETIFNSWLRAGIPEDIRVAHKYGSELRVVNEAGIIYTEKPFVLVIMTQGVVEKEANSVIPELARMIFDFHIQ